ncbi:transmembrane protein 39A-like [Argiope bruennichi]|uniref:transmembrane protein 39A-like n=1 Tax=Argiope bruennichi TaxID=94029 RepID=UPI0024959B54|nr:transmembrane protein 39A-like [Argiope bruennichi]
MPGGRRNAKSSSFKHHAHASDDRHSDLPTQPQVLPPKHIPMPEIPLNSDFHFEMDALLLSLFAMAGQYINLYSSVFWLPYSHNEDFLNYYLIDYYVLTINLIMLSRRIPVSILKKLCSVCFPSSYQSTCTLCIHILIITCLAPVLLFCFYFVTLEHGILSIVFLIYPFVVYVSALGTNVTKFLEIKSPPSVEKIPAVKSKNAAANNKNNSVIHHVCSMSAETIREEVETLRNDFNIRLKQVLFNSFLVVYHATFLPCYFSPNTLHYDVHFVTQYGVFTGIGCFTLYISHCFPPKYCDVLHKAALHLGRWQRVEIKNVHVPYSTWTETAMWNQGALVKHSKELFKAEGISNAAEPGHAGHSRFYSLFKNPAIAAQLVWLLLLFLLFAEVFVLVQSHTWNDLFSIQLLIMINCKTLYTLTRIYFVVKKIYHEEKVIISKFSN